MSNHEECKNPREKAHAEDRAALREYERRPWIIIAVAILALIAVAGLIFNVVNRSANANEQKQTEQVQQAVQQVKVAVQQAQQAADAARAQALAGCTAYKLIAEAPVAVNASAFGLQISVALRIAYDTAGCVPALAPADPRVAALLPPGMH